jgi:hypothetical protein
MIHILTEDQKKEFINRVGVVYRNFKHINRGSLQCESAYRMGIVDFCDSLVFVSSEMTYDICSIRAEIEYLFDEIDNENN